MMMFEAPAGVNSVRNFTAFGRTSQATKMPAKSSGTAAATNPIE